MAGKRRNNMNLTHELRTAADEIIALELEKKEIGDTINERYDALAEKGIDVAAFKVSVKRRKESATQRAARRERDAIADVYSAAMGDLFGKPLDDLTRTRMEEERQRLAQMGQPAGDTSGEPKPEPLPGTAAEPITAEQIAAAREEGKTARLAEPPARIVDNPYHSADPRRAAWDEGWCEGDGSDGMEIPAAWRRKPEEKPDDKKKGNEGEQQPDDGNKPDDKKPPQGGGGDGGDGGQS